MNKLILMGRLTRDPNIRHTENDNCIAKFSMAVDRKFKREGEPDADFFNCTAFGRQADFVEKYLYQGTKILLTGRVQNDNYTNQYGEKVYSVGVIVEEIEFCESKAAQARKESGSNDQGTGQGTDKRNDQENDMGFMNIPEGADEDLPWSN